MNRILLIVILLSLLKPVIGQKEKINYQILEDNPGGYKKTILFLEPSFSEAYKGFAMGYGFKIETQISDFMPWFHYKKAYLDVNTISSVVDILPANGLEKFSIMELGATWFFVNKDEKTEIGMNLTSDKYMDYYIKASGTKKMMHGIDFGWFHSKNSYAFDVDIDLNVHEMYQYQRVKDGYQVPIYFKVPQGIAQPEGSQWMPYTSYATNTFFFGYRFRTTINYKLNADGYGVKKKRTVFDWYTHLFFAPQTELYNVLDTKGVEWSIIPYDSKKANSNFGFRTGFSIRAANFLQFYAETGYKPGPKFKDSALNGVFINYGFGFFIGSKKGFLLKE